MDFWNGKKKSFEILHYWERLMTFKYMIWAWDGICCNLPQIQKKCSNEKDNPKEVMKLRFNWFHFHEYFISFLYSNGKVILSFLLVHSPSCFFLFLSITLSSTQIRPLHLYEVILLSPFLRVSCSCMKQPLFHPIPIDPWNLWTEYRFVLQKWFQNCWTIYTKSMLCLFLTQLVYIHYLIIF